MDDEGDDSAVPDPLGLNTVDLQATQAVHMSGGCSADTCWCPPPFLLSEDGLDVA